jgi:hypothetical protein
LKGESVTLQTIYLEEMLAHLELVEQLAMDIREENLEWSGEVSDSVDLLIERLVAAVMTVLPFLPGAEPIHVLRDDNRRTSPTGFILGLGKFSGPTQNKAFDSIYLLVDGRLRFTGDLWKDPSRPMDFKWTTWKWAPQAKIGLARSMAMAIKALMETEIPRMVEKRQETEAAKKRIDQACAVLGASN